VRIFLDELRTASGLTPRALADAEDWPQRTDTNPRRASSSIR